MDNSEEILNQAKGIIDNAALMLDKERKEHHTRSMPIIITEMMKQAKSHRLKRKEVFVGFIAPQSTLNHDDHNPLGISDEELRNNSGDYVSAQLSLFYGFGDKQEAIECFTHVESAVMAHHLQPEGTAAFMMIREKGYDIAALVAANCLTLSRIVNTGKPNEQASTEHVDLIQNHEADKFFNLSGLDELQANTVRSLLEFHLGPSVMQRQMPNVYKLMLKKVTERVEEFKREEDIE